MKGIEELTTLARYMVRGMNDLRQYDNVTA